MKILLLALSLWAGLAQAQPASLPLKSGVFSPPRSAPEIGLPASTGKPFSLAALKGKVVVLAFGYTNCPSVCPVSLASLVQARKLLGAAASSVQVVFVTVDPERDSIAHLRDYLAQFDPGFIGIAGTAAQTAALLRDYGISARRIQAKGDGKEYFIDHSSYLYFVDRQGRLRALMPFGRPAADIAHDLAILVKP
jgi:protein SCO1/2